MRDTLTETLGLWLDHAGLGLGVFDEAGRFRTSNPRATELLGASEGALDDALGLEPGAALAWRDAASSSPLEGGAGAGIRLRRCGGVEPSASMPFVVEDVSRERALAEEATFLGRAVDRLESLALAEHAAGAIAHDLNNVLQAVMARAELIEERDADVHALLELADRASRLTRALLRNGREHTHAPFSSPNAVLAELTTTLESMLRGRGRVTLGENVPDVALPAPAIERILLNLVANARDATARSGSVSIRTACEGDHVLLEVSDEGPGMAEATLERARELAFTTKAKGTGLGLTLVQRIVRRAGGRLEIESEVGRGTTVRVLLPRFVPGERSTTTG